MHIKKFIGVLSGLVLSAFMFSSNIVFASDLPASFPAQFPPDVQGYFEDIQNNDGMSYFDGEISILITPNQQGTIRGIVLSVQENYDLPAVQWVRDHGECWVGNYALFQGSPNNLDSCVFDYHTYDPTIEQWGIVKWDNIQNYEAIMGYVNNGSYVQNGLDHNFYYLLTVENSYVPEYDVINMPFYSLDVDGFEEWLINNDKVSVDVSSGGASVGGKIPAYIGVQKLKSYIKFYKDFGSSNVNFSKKIWSWFSYMNILGQTQDNINILKSTTDMLYQEYINYRSGTHAYWPSATKIQERQNIDTVTDDNNTTLITDDSNDTIDISILRDILRGVISISNNIIETGSKIIDKLEQLEFVVNVSNGGGSVPDLDLSKLYLYDSDAFADDLQAFQSDIEDVQSVPMGCISDINQNSLMPENMLEDKNSLTVNIPTITGFTVGNNGSAYTTQTGSYVLRSIDYPWLDTAVQKIKRFASILLIIGYLVHLRYRIPEIVRGE